MTNKDFSALRTFLSDVYPYGIMDTEGIAQEDDLIAHKLSKDGNGKEVLVEYEPCVDGEETVNMRLFVKEDEHSDFSLVLSKECNNLKELVTETLIASKDYLKVVFYS